MAESCAAFKENVCQQNKNKCFNCGKAKEKHPTKASSHQIRIPGIQSTASHPAMTKNSKNAQRRGDDTTSNQVTIDNSQSLLCSNMKALIITTTKTDEDTFHDSLPTELEPAAELTTELNTLTIGSPAQSTQDVVIHDTPESWVVEQVVDWLESVGLGEFIENFKDNEIDGSLLMSDGLDDTTLKQLVAKIKYQIMFKNELAKLKSKYQEKSIVSTTDSNDAQGHKVLPAG
ncbi:unnamed protein product [Adineta steineri]|uniref:SAM domain-containing protein n=1 Tax=Adineta steineri TaxID=433720 RepID=A0A813WQX5_9BILA|nr:unnamed protein product [Adineta steineri]CAF1505871.1 unnamed protein product [Adineta steineri]